ncbi:carbohydrate ABC transporter permease [Litorisediminicola beolgyonensis]|uniref:Carbohydrate ABC transporter permease n=1 Tax=Litorisediminicola beolgyonensis TaxID=1173614 RepID=A0ABW3ZJJ1_9RHOB
MSSPAKGPARTPAALSRGGWAKPLQHGLVTAPLVGVLWLAITATAVAVACAFLSGAAFRPSGWPVLILGAALGVSALWLPRLPLLAGSAVVVLVTMLLGVGPVVSEVPGALSFWVAALATGLGAGEGVHRMVGQLAPAPLTRHEFEDAVIRFLTGFGYVFFTAIVAIPFYVMVMTSLKNQQQLVQNPLDFSLDLSQGWGLFSSYYELMTQFNFGSYLWTSFYVSVLTVLLTLLFSIPGAYAVARLRFRGAAVFSRSILLIYMVPMIVLALPIYIGYSMIGLRNTIFGIVLIYPVTTIPVALYMLQGYFRGLPAEVEEAGLMDGLSRLQVIWKITLPLSLPALASVSLYVFMIAWNEFLLAFMLLDDPSKFTLTRGVAMLNSSEIPRQHLMAGSVIATVPIMAIFLGLERFMTKGLTAGSVKG